MPPRLKYIFDIVKCPDWKAFWIFGHGYVISIFQTLSHSCMVEARSIESVCTSSLLKSMKKVKDSLWELKYWLLLIMPIPGLCYPKPCRRLRVQQRLSLSAKAFSKAPALSALGAGLPDRRQSASWSLTEFQMQHPTASVILGVPKIGPKMQILFENTHLLWVSN